MYAVVQIGSRTLRSAWGTKRKVPPRFCACTNGARAAAAVAMDPATKARRLSWGMAAKPPREGPILARGPVSGNLAAVVSWPPDDEARAGSRGDRAACGGPAAGGLLAARARGRSHVAGSRRCDACLPPHVGSRPRQDDVERR